MPLFKSHKNNDNTDQSAPAQDNLQRDNVRASGAGSAQAGMNPAQNPNAGVRDQGAPAAGGIANNQGRTGGTANTAGRMQETVGDMLGSNALKARGAQKQQEANAINLQGQELAEAERLEREAVMRRERAVAHGAHPENKHLGATGGSHQQGSHSGGGTGGGYGAQDAYGAQQGGAGAGPQGPFEQQQGGFAAPHGGLL